MRALVIRLCGGPEELVIQDLPDPVPAPGHLVIEVEARIRTAKRTRLERATCAAWSVNSQSFAAIPPVLCDGGFPGRQSEAALFSSRVLKPGRAGAEVESIARQEKSVPGISVYAYVQAIPADTNAVNRWALSKRAAAVTITLAALLRQVAGGEPVPRLKARLKAASDS